MTTQNPATAYVRDNKDPEVMQVSNNGFSPLLRESDYGEATEISKG